MLSSRQILVAQMGCMCQKRGSVPPGLHRWLSLADNWKISKYCLRAHGKHSEYYSTKMLQGLGTLCQSQYDGTYVHRTHSTEHSCCILPGRWSTHIWGLSWREHVKQRISKAYCSFWLCCRTLGESDVRLRRIPSQLMYMPECSRQKYLGSYPVQGTVLKGTIQESKVIFA
jgi:hypothetical protein